jgi:hypothetical protein
MSVTLGRNEVRTAIRMVAYPIGSESDIVVDDTTGVMIQPLEVAPGVDN